MDSGQDHPPYRGICYFVADIMFGRDRTSAPNIEFILGRWPEIDWITAAAEINDDANPIAVLAEWLQDSRFGLGLPDSQLDTTALDLIANQLESEGCGLSPIVSQTQSARQAITQLLEYIDGYLAGSTDGKITVGLVRPDADDAPEVEERDMLGDPEFTIASWGDTHNECQVRYTNRDRGFKEDMASYRDLGNLEITAEPKALTVQRPWVTDGTLAQEMAQALGRAAAIPDTTGRLKITATKAADLAQGGLFALWYDAMDVAGTPYRITEMTWQALDKPECSITFRRDTSDLNQDFTTQVDTVSEPVAIDPEPFAEPDILIAEMTLRYTRDYVQKLAFIASRPNRLTTGFILYRDIDPGGFEDAQKWSYSRFGQRGHLLASYASTTRTVDRSKSLQIQLSPIYLAGGGAVTASQSGTAVTLSASHSDLAVGRTIVWDSGETTKLVSGSGTSWVGNNSQTVSSGSFDIYRDGSDLTLDQPDVYGAVDGQYLMFIKPSAGLHYLEVISVFIDPDDFQLGTNQYKLCGIRGFLDTDKLAFTANTPFWLVKRAYLDELTSAEPWATESSWRFRPLLSGRAIDMALVESTAFSGVGVVWQHLRPTNVRCNGVGYNPSWSSGTVILTWSNRHGLRGAWWNADGWHAPVHTGNVPFVDIKLLKPISGTQIGLTYSPDPWAQTYGLADSWISAAFASSDLANYIRIAVYLQGTLLGDTILLRKEI